MTDSSVSRQKWDWLVTNNTKSLTWVYSFVHLPPRQSWGFIRGHCNLHHTLFERLSRVFFPIRKWSSVGAVLGTHQEFCMCLWKTDVTASSTSRLRPHSSVTWTGMMGARLCPRTAIDRYLQQSVATPKTSDGYYWARDSTRSRRKELEVNDDAWRPERAAGRIRLAWWRRVWNTQKNTWFLKDKRK